VIPAVVAVAVALASATATTAPHETRVSSTRVVVEGRTVLLRVRMFRDDLDSALVRYAGRPTARAMRTPAGDSLVNAYLAPRIVVRANGAVLTGRLTDAGGEDDPSGEPVWWVLLEYTAPRNIGALAMRQAILMDVFPRQQNLVTAFRSADGARASLYFTGGSDGEQVVQFSR
jgi:hypothetical protein